MMKVKLNVNNRFALAGVLPRMGNIAKIRKIKQLQDKLLLTAKEKKELHVISQGQQTHWDESLEKEGKVFEIDSLICKMVAKELKKRSDENKLATHLVDIYDLFVEGKHGDNSAEGSQGQESDQASDR